MLIPPHLLPAVGNSISATDAEWGRDGGLLSRLQNGWASGNGNFTQPGTVPEGRRRMHWHSTTSAIRALCCGSELLLHSPNLMNRLGHSSPRMVSAYQHVAEDRDTEIARRLSELAK